MSDTINASIEIPKPPDGWEFVGYEKPEKGDMKLYSDSWLPAGLNNGRGLIARKTVTITEDSSDD